MLHNIIPTFSFNAEKFDFWKIYERIKLFYPIGIPREDMFFHNSYPGRKELISLLDNNIQNDKNFKHLWESFDKEIRKITGKKVTGTTSSQCPCFSSYVELETKKYKSLVQFKELYYFVSLVGNFYTIIGQNRNELREDKNIFWTTNYLVVSPEKEYAEIFSTLSEQIELRFKGFQFVPFYICTQKINGLDVRDSIEKQDSIFSAIFNSQIELNNRIIGDKFYKISDWIKDGYVDDGRHWTIYPPQ